MKLPHRRRFLHLAASAAALPAVSRMARAQSYPTRPVRIVFARRSERHLRAPDRAMAVSLLRAAMLKILLQQYLPISDITSLSFGHLAGAGERPPFAEGALRNAAS